MAAILNVTTFRLLRLPPENFVYICNEKQLTHLWKMSWFNQFYCTYHFTVPQFLCFFQKSKCVWAWRWYDMPCWCSSEYQSHNYYVTRCVRMLCRLTMYTSTFPLTGYVYCKLEYLWGYFVATAFTAAPVTVPADRALARILKMPVIFERVPIQNGPKWAKIV